jgi:hypothetical protein
MFKVHPKYVRPGSTVRISATYTKLTEQTWADASVAFSYTIADADFLETNAEAVKIKYNGQLVEATATVSGNTITVSPLASAIIDYYGSAYTVEIYYKAKSIKLDTVETAYDHNNTYYEGQYGIDEQGRIIPMSIMGVDFTGITEDYSYPKVTVETQYDLRGLAYDPYRKAFWSIENNNKYLTLRSSNNLSIITNYSLYMDRTISPFYIDDVRHYLYNYTPQTIINFASLKYYEGMLYILSTNGTLYTLNPHYDLAPIDFEFDDDGNLEYTPIALSHASAPVDFTFDRDGNLLVTEPDGEIQKYNCYRDYAFVDRENNEVYFREKYDYIDIDDTPGSV